MNLNAYSSLGMLVLRTVALVVLLAVATLARGHIVPESDWHPVARAYLSSVFFLNLKPVDWALIDRTLVAIDESGDNTALRTAITARDRLAFYAALTRATSQALRRFLRDAELRLDAPGAGLAEVHRARELYRAFEAFIRQTDKDAFARLGVAWLDLLDSVGRTGFGGLDEQPVDRGRFVQARKVVYDYLIANYEADEFAERDRFAPIPEQVWRRNRQLEVEPWLPPGSTLADQDPLPRLVLKFEQQGIQERELFLVAFGDMLFDSPALFGEPAASLGLACSTCHNRGDINQQFLIPGISHRAGAVDVDSEFFNPHFNDRRFDSLDIPSLRGVRFTAPYGRDGRFASLRNFTRNVIVNEFGGPEPTPLILDALVAYINEFEFLPAPYLQPNGVLVDDASASAKRGERLFRQPFPQMDNRSCADCHLPSASFRDGRIHNIGSGEPLDTPTLLNANYTAPYFHDGSLPTLAAVVDWFDNTFDLNLTDQQRTDLSAYLEAVGAGEQPYEQFDDNFTRFRLAYEELSTFLYGLDQLIPARDRFHAELLVRSVARDLRLDASLMAARGHLEKVFDLADRLEAIRTAIDQERWGEAASLWTAYRTIAAEYEPHLR